MSNSTVMTWTEKKKRRRKKRKKMPTTIEKMSTASVMTMSGLSMMIAQMMRMGPVMMKE